METEAKIKSWRDWFSRQQDAMVAELGWLVEQETPSGAASAINSVQEALAERFSRLGGRPEIVPASGGNHLVVRFGQDRTGQLLAIGHVDTVWPMGTLARKPFRVEDNLAYGPGVYDMKAGIIILLFAIRALKDHELVPERPFTLLFNADEEVGSPTSRALIEEEAKKAESVLILEPPLESGALKTARKGVGRFTLEVKGRAAHAGVEPEKGVNALVELAHQVLAINALNDLSRGTTLNVGQAQGGTRSNVVPAEAVAEIDLRVSTLDEAERIIQSLNALQPVLPQAHISIKGGLNRPPFERTAGVSALFQKAQAIAAAIESGETLTEGATGGGSDGNFTAALGVATLDGLGAVGKGAHAEHEQVQIASLPRRAHLLAGILAGF